VLGAKEKITKSNDQAGNEGKEKGVDEGVKWKEGLTIADEFN